MININRNHFLFIKFTAFLGRSKPLPYGLIYIYQNLWDDGLIDLKENFIEKTFPSSYFPVAKRLNLGDFYLNLTACLGGAEDSVQNSLVVNNLAGGHGCFAAV